MGNDPFLTEGDYMENNASISKPYALKKDDGSIYRYGIDFVIKASEIRQGSGASVLEYTTKKGEEPPDHTHGTEDEMFYVLEGAITFRCGGESFDLEKGGFMFLPRGMKHGYIIRSDEAVRLLVITAPTRDGVSGGWGGFVADMEKDPSLLVPR
jgi:quercetin dioxygenase-like cupin family protein